MSLAKTHENYAATWNTPPEWMAWANETLEGYLFDPCPANWSGHIDGLTTTWGINTYLNHPGSRGSTAKWWMAAMNHLSMPRTKLIWCAFSPEQPRHMHPHPRTIPGWMIEPRARIGFIWGGPDTVLKNGKLRKHGDRCKSPGQQTIFWSSVEPAATPEPCVITRTGL